MQDIPLLELVRGAGQDVGPDPGGIDEQQGKHVLKLIAKAESTAGLVKTRARQDARRQRLINQPAIDHQIEGAIRCLHADAREQIVPFPCQCGFGLRSGRGYFPLPGQRHGLFVTRGITEEECDFVACAGSKVDMDLIGAAGVGPGDLPVAQPPPAQRFGFRIAPLPAKELLTVAGETVRLMGGTEEGAPFGKVSIPGIGSDDELLRFIETARNMMAGDRWERSQQPFAIISRGEPAMPPGIVPQPKADQLYRGIRRHEDPLLLFQPVRDATPFGIAHAMPNMACLIVSGRGRRHRPDGDRFLVSQVEGFAGAVDYRIVRPRRDTMFAAVDRPGKAATAFGDQRAEGFVGQYVGPGRRGALSRCQPDHIFAPITREATILIEKRQLFALGSLVGHNGQARESR